MLAFRTFDVFSGRVTLSLRHGFHTSTISTAIDKARLSQLRKKTGFPFIKCKNALEKFDNDIKKATKWLKEEAQKEGWAKATKLQNRPMSHGLVGVLMQNQSSVMVEVNCETDFVSRNVKFHQLVSTAAKACLQKGKEQSDNKVLWNKEAVNKLQWDSGKSLADLVALEVGNIGENLAIRRAAYLNACDNNNICMYVHPAGPGPLSVDNCSMGKFSSMVVLTQTVSPDNQLSVEELGRQLCQHIVGMNPKSVGSLEKEEQSHAAAFGHVEQSDEAEQVAAAVGGGADVMSSMSSDDQSEIKETPKDDESRLVFQEFLMDESLTVGELLRQNSAVVTDFVRFGCGEELEEEEDAGA